MRDDNPYATPKSEVLCAEDQAPDMLASRQRRLLAQLIDVIIMSPLVWFLYNYLTLPYVTGLTGHDAIVAMTHADTLKSILASAMSGALLLTCFLLFNWYMLKDRGQSIGKRVAGIRIVNIDRSQASMTTILKRYIFSQLVALIPIAGQLLTLIDYVFIFSESRRCVHDHVAGTVVVKA